MNPTATNRSGRRQRRGVAAVEFALTVPVMLLLFFACLDFVRYNLLRNVITNAAYEGARTAIVPGNTKEDVEKIIKQKMAPVGGMMDYTITIEPDRLPTSQSEVKVTLDVDISKGGFVVSRYFTKNRVIEELTIMNENAVMLSNR